MELIKRLVKRILIELLYRFGILRLIRNKNRQKITVLMVHGVMAAHDAVSWNPLRKQLCPDELARVLSILADYYQFVTIEQCADMLDGKVPVIDHALMVSFDDGYRNNIDFALPICERFGIRPVLFVATGHIDSGLPFWFDRLDYALQQNMGGQIELDYKDKKYSFNATSRQALTSSYQDFRDRCKQDFSDDVLMNNMFSSLSLQLEQRSGKALSDICQIDDWSAIVTWSQLRDCIKDHRLDIASHTVDHWRLASLTEGQIVSQLRLSKSRIEQELRVNCDYFCYPNGEHNELALSLVNQLGYRAAFSTMVGVCAMGDDMLTLKRFNFPSLKTKAQVLYLLNRIL